jgi:diguanylate cyclase (GGDEF)-like protein
MVGNPADGALPQLAQSCRYLDMSLQPSKMESPVRGSGLFLLPLDEPGTPSTNGFLKGLPAHLLAGGGLILVALIAFLDFYTGPYLSFSAFYLIPVAVCAWWGGFAHGILLSIAGALAWNVIEAVENPMIPASAGLWNGIVRFGTLFLTSSLVSRLHAGVLRERLLARTDPLTEAANGRTFYETAAVEAERSRRAGRPLTLAYIDLDHFKQLNDRLGHAVGDAALRHVVKTIQVHLRSTDLLARLGGDEFALLLPETAAEGALPLLTRLQGVLVEEMAGKGWPVTLSIGAVTFLLPPVDVDLMIQRADALMYQAKRHGKGRVEHALVPLGPAAENKEGRWLERRATARVLCDCQARVRCQGQGKADEEFAAVRDISTEGIGLYLEKRLHLDTVLIVEPLSTEAMTLLARVVWATPEGSGWVHGCLLSARLSTEELTAWLGQQEAKPCV